MQIGASVARRFVLERHEEYDLDGVTRFVARDTRLDRLVNVDFLTTLAPSAVVTAASRARVLRDKRLARVLAVGRERLQGSTKQVAYVVTERPDGVHVGDLLGLVQFAPATAAAVVGEAAAGLQAASLAGEHHGQIRPRALTVTESGRVIVSGFGVDGELAAQAGRKRGRDERSDAVALAKIYLTAVTGLDADDVTPDDLPDDLPAVARSFALAVIKGKGPRTLAEITVALGTGNTAVLRQMAAEAPSLWWPPAPVAEGGFDALNTVDLDVADGYVATTDVTWAPSPDELAVVEDDAEAVAVDTTTGAIAVIDEEVVEPEELLPAPRPRTRFGGAVDDINEFHDIVAEQNLEDKPAVLELVLTRLSERYPSSQALARMAEAARVRARSQAPINAAPLMIGIGLTVLFVGTIIALSTMSKTYIPAERPYENPKQTYPPFTFGIEEPSPSAEVQG